MKRTFTLYFRALLTFGILFTGINSVTAQCPNGVVGNVALSPDCDQNTDVTLNSGDYHNMVVGKGGTFNFNTCATSYDARVYAKKNSINGPLIFDFDNNRTAGNCGLGNENFDWTSDFTGVMYVAVHSWNCTWTLAQNSAVLGYSQIKDFNYAGSTAPMDLCTETSRLLTIGGNDTSGSWLLNSGNATIQGDTLLIPSGTGQVDLTYAVGACLEDVVIDVIDNEIKNVRIARVTSDTSIVRLNNGTFDSITWYSSIDGMAWDSISDSNRLDIVCDRYYFALVDSQGCVSSSDTFIKICPDTVPSSIEAYELADVRLYPNPAAEAITLEIGNAEANVMVYNLQGQLIRAITMRPYEKKEMLELQPGMYTIVVESSEARLTRKVLVTGR
jgi:hypothetical protein